MNERILCVDDDPSVLAAHERNLRKLFRIETCLEPAEALTRITTQGPFAVVMADMRMPGMDGLQFLTELIEKAPDTVRIMLTGNADQQTAVGAVNQGHVFRFLNKPCSLETLTQTLSAAVRQYQLTVAERELLERTLSGSIKMLTDILAMQEPLTFGRCQIVRDYLRTFLKSFVAGPAWQLEVASMLYRVGLITIPPSVLEKYRTQKTLTATEQAMLARVPEMGADLLANIPRLEPVADIVRYQSKHFNGSGYPSNPIAGADIPIGARVLKVLVDLVDLEGSGLPRGSALFALKERAGWYDPQVLEAVFASFGVDHLAKVDFARLAGRLIKASELEPGQVLLSNIETQDGMMILAAGNEISPMLLQKIRNFGALSGLKEPIAVHV